jgi:hypothetical protein
MLIPTNMSDIELDFVLCGVLLLEYCKDCMLNHCSGYGHTLIVLSFWHFFV